MDKKLCKHIETLLPQMYDGIQDRQHRSPRLRYTGDMNYLDRVKKEYETWHGGEVSFMQYLETFKSLNSLDREALVMRFEQNMGLQAISEELRLVANPNSAKRVIDLAMAKIKNEMGAK